jgi:arylsulfatase A-like enzyme
VHSTAASEIGDAGPSFEGDNSLVIAHKLPTAATLNGTVECRDADRGRLSFSLIGTEKGVLHRVWSAAIDEADQATLTFSVQVPSHGEWVGGVFTLRGRNVDRARLQVQRLLLTFEREPPQTPNIVLLTLDTFRADCLSAMSDKAPHTPALDSLAHAGLLFEDAVATSQCTNPSHVSILTGLYCFAHRVYTNHQGLASEAVTLAEILKSHGYRTFGAVSASHLNPQTSNLGQGFDVFVESRWASPGGEPAGVRTASVLRRFQLGYDNPDPIFAWVHYFDPHTPYSPPDEYTTRYPFGQVYDSVRYVNGMGGVAYDTTTGLVLDPQGEANRYRGEVAYLDTQIEVLLEGLRSLGLLEKAVVIVVGDHGEGLGEHGVYFQHAGLFEPVTHVPMILCGEGIPRGVRVATRVSTVDLFPTILNLVGIEEAPQTYGVDLIPLVTGTESVPRDLVFSEAVSNKICAGWNDDLKTIWVPEPREKDWTMPQRTLCFALDVDPEELTNIAQQAQEQVVHVKSAWERMVAAPLASFDPFQGHRDDERLRALGYME